MDALNVESAGVELGAKGHVTVDDWQVNVPTAVTDGRAKTSVWLCCGSRTVAVTVFCRLVCFWRS